MELGPLLPPELAAGHELRHVLSAAFFLEFDEDGSGRVDRAEFRNNLWMLTRASKAEKMRYAFARLDLNASSFLERDDLAGSMRRQLRLVRSILPLLVRHELRRGEVRVEARFVKGGAAERGEAALCAEATALADSMIDGLSAQVDTLVDEVFAQLDVERGGRISLEEWRAAWRVEP